MLTIPIVRRAKQLLNITSVEAGLQSDPNDYTDFLTEAASTSLFSSVANDPITKDPVFSFSLNNYLDY